MNVTMTRLVLLLGLLWGLLTIPVSAAPIVTATASPDDSGWVVSFAIQDTLTTISPEMDPFRLYIFGVALPHDIEGSPDGWDPMNGLDPHYGDYFTWGCQFNCNNTHYGGSVTHYTNWWSGITPAGGTSSGFEVHVAGMITPVPWFAFAYAQTYASLYSGSDHFYFAYNPGFEGAVTPQLYQEPDVFVTQDRATAIPVPEPSGLLLLGLGVVWSRMRR